MTTVATQKVPEPSRVPGMAPTGLVLLALSPIIAGGMRLTEPN